MSNLILVQNFYVSGSFEEILFTGVNLSSKLKHLQTQSCHNTDELIWAQFDGKKSVEA